ncbi:PREDICTED: ethylmalonyl-CoA decarboxylase-like [Rhagoletis zephyria]|uniref:ethylmalonyl-CoA decarboxylase-like n=1 Tax=Rhagoletis zephyria TaxID=28612 RepID=UPI000811A734|nr:PREDICTED: ethylmalonyl-CoA decarboxylase-like [Rhagoletis zephyria]
MITLMQDNLARLQALPLITVAYIEGMALGGGAELVTACDYRLSRENAIIGFVQVRIGITTVWGGGARLVQLIGYPKALNLIATGRTFSGIEGARMGFIDQLLPSVETVISNAHQTAQLQAKPPTSYSVAHHQAEVLQNARQFLMPFLVLPKETMLTGKAVASESRPKLDDALQAELQHGLKVWGGPIHQKALSGKVNHKRDN